MCPNGGKSEAVKEQDQAILGKHVSEWLSSGLGITHLGELFEDVEPLDGSSDELAVHVGRPDVSEGGGCGKAGILSVERVCAVVESYRRRIRH